MEKKIFRAAKGAQFEYEKAQIYGQELERIRKENGGVLTPQLVLNEAKDKNNLLHDYFEWDNTVAADKFRINLARHLINHIEIVIVSNGTEKQQRAYLNVTKANENNDEEVQRVYVTIEKALSEPELRKQVLANALREAEFWKEKYHDYKELSEVFLAIDKTKKKIKF